MEIRTPSRLAVVLAIAVPVFVAPAVARADEPPAAPLAPSASPPALPSASVSAPPIAPVVEPPLHTRSPGLVGGGFGVLLLGLGLLPVGFGVSAAGALAGTQCNGSKCAETGAVVASGIGIGALGLGGVASAIWMMARGAKRVPDEAPLPRAGARVFVAPSGVGLRF